MRYRLRLTPLVLVVAALALVLLVAACGADEGPDASPSADPVVATVNEHPVRESAVATVRAERRLSGARDSRAGAVREAIDRELIRQEAKRLGVEADAAIVRSRLADLTKQNGGEAAFAGVLETAGITQAQLHQIITDGALREALQDAKYAGLDASEDAARAYYERHSETFREAAAVRLAAISVSAERIAENALERVRDGQPFDQVSRQFTTDPELKAQNGDLGWVLRSSLPKPLQTVTDTLAKGEVSEPVGFFGRWYVLKLKDRREARTVPFAEVRSSLDEALTRQKRARALAAWLEEARRGAGVTQP